MFAAQIFRVSYDIIWFIDVDDLANLFETAKEYSVTLLSSIPEFIRIHPTWKLRATEEGFLRTVEVLKRWSTSWPNQTAVCWCMYSSYTIPQLYFVSFSCPNGKETHHSTTCDGKVFCIVDMSLNLAAFRGTNWGFQKLVWFVLNWTQYFCFASC